MSQIVDYTNITNEILVIGPYTFPALGEIVFNDGIGDPILDAEAGFTLTKRIDGVETNDLSLARWKDSTGSALIKPDGTEVTPGGGGGGGSTAWADITGKPAVIAAGATEAAARAAIAAITKLESLPEVYGVVQVAHTNTVSANVTITGAIPDTGGVTWAAGQLRFAFGGTGSGNIYEVQANGTSTLKYNRALAADGVSTDFVRFVNLLNGLGRNYTVVTKAGVHTVVQGIGNSTDSISHKLSSNTLTSASIAINDALAPFTSAKTVYPHFTHTSLSLNTPVTLGGPIPGTIGDTFQGDWTEFVSTSFAGTMGNTYKLNTDGTAWILQSEMPDNSYRVAVCNPVKADSGYNAFSGVLVFRRAGATRELVFYVPSMDLVKTNPAVSNSYEYLSDYMSNLPEPAGDPFTAAPTAVNVLMGSTANVTLSTGIPNSINELWGNGDDMVSVASGTMGNTYNLVAGFPGVWQLVSEMPQGYKWFKANYDATAAAGKLSHGTLLLVYRDGDTRTEIARIPGLPMVKYDAVTQGNKLLTNWLGDLTTVSSGTLASALSVRLANATPAIVDGMIDTISRTAFAGVPLSNRTSVQWTDGQTVLVKDTGAIATFNAGTFGSAQNIPNSTIRTVLVKNIATVSGPTTQPAGVFTVMKDGSGFVTVGSGTVKVSGDDVFYNSAYTINSIIGDIDDIDWQQGSSLTEAIDEVNTKYNDEIGDVAGTKAFFTSVGLTEPLNVSEAISSIVGWEVNRSGSYGLSLFGAELQLSQFSYVTHTTTANFTVIPPAMDTANAFGPSTTVYVRIIQGATPRTVSWHSSIKWAGGIAPALTAVAGAVDILTLTTFDGGVTWMATLSKDHK